MIHISRSGTPFGAVLALACIYSGCSAQDTANEPSSHISEDVTTTTGAPATSTPVHSASSRSYIHASVRALPGLDCQLYPQGRASSAAVSVFTDEDGFARFDAVRATADAAVQRLTLDCVDREGRSSSYPVDLRSDATFVARPFNTADAPGVDRPALTGDPLGLTQSELIQRGYGLRPDPVNDASGYASWLRMVSMPARMLQPKMHFFAEQRARSSPNESRDGGNTAPGGAVGGGADAGATTGSPWTGAVLQGESPNYASTTVTFTVPTALPGADDSVNTGVYLGDGLGGFGNTALIQGGVAITTTPTAASYVSLREYCCGYPQENNGSTVSPGIPVASADVILSQEWYCDSVGNINVNGGYGCTYLYDYNTRATLNCVKANAALPACASVPKGASGTPGLSGEFIAELGNGVSAWPAFSPAVQMTGTVTTTSGATFNVNSDPNVTLLMDFTSSTTQMSVTVGSSNQTTYFTVAPGQALGPVAPSGSDIDVYWQGRDNSLWHKWYVPGTGTGGWNGPQSLGGTLGSPPHPVATGNGVVDVFWTGSDTNLWYQWYDPNNGGWTGHGPTNLGAGPLGSAPQPVSPVSGQADVYWRGTDASLWHEWYVPGTGTGGWNGPQSLGGTLDSPPHPVATGNGVVDVFWTGSDSNLWYRWYDPSNGGWTGHGPTSLGAGPLGSDPQPVSATAGQVDVFWQGTDNALWHEWYQAGTGTNGWNGPQSLGGTLGSPPHPVASGNGVIDVFWKGTDGNLWHRWYDPNNGGWTGHGPASLGSGPLGSDPYPTSPGSGTIDVFWEGTDSNLWHNWYVPNVGWQSQPQSLGSGPL